MVVAFNEVIIKDTVVGLVDGVESGDLRLGHRRSVDFNERHQFLSFGRYQSWVTGARIESRWKRGVRPSITVGLRSYINQVVLSHRLGPEVGKLWSYDWILRMVLIHSTTLNNFTHLRKPLGAVFWNRWETWNNADVVQITQVWS